MNEVVGLKKLEEYVDERHDVNAIVQNGDDIILISFDDGTEFEIIINKKGFLEVIKLPEFG